MTKTSSKRSMVQKFIHHESMSGLLLIAAAIFALILDNSPLGWLYDGFTTLPVAVQIGALHLDKPLLLWINDGLMAVFFLLIGLEIKREVLEGELSTLSKMTLPVIAAMGGLICPALIYVAINAQNPEALQGWGVPVATDIAFALGVLSLLGDRVPVFLKTLLLSLAIIDDIGAIIVIAVFYTENLSLFTLSLASLGLVGAFVMNRMGVKRVAAYILVGVFMWVCVLKSGVHATLAGVVLALFIPIKGKTDQDKSPLRELEHDLHPWAAYFIMPIFAFANAGVPLSGFSLEMFLEPVPLGILLGLFVGKQFGVFSFIYVAVKSGLCTLPENIKWAHIYGLALLTGIGFTMSLFIGTLAFTDPDIAAQVRISILCASLLAAVAGYSVLRLVGKRKS